MQKGNIMDTKGRIEAVARHFEAVGEAHGLHPQVTRGDCGVTVFFTLDSAPGKWMGCDRRENVIEDLHAAEFPVHVTHWRTARSGQVIVMATWLSDYVQEAADTTDTATRKAARPAPGSG